MIKYKKYNLIKDLGFIKTGVKEYIGKKKYYSTGSIKPNKINPEGEYSYLKRPSRANRQSYMNDVFQARMMNTNKAILIKEELNEGLFSTGFFQFRPPQNIILPEYLCYYLSSSFFLREKDKLCNGSTQKAINDASLKKFNIYLPEIEEQNRIIKKIKKINSQINFLESEVEKQKIKSKLLQESVFINELNTNKYNDKDWQNKKFSDLAYTAGRIGWKGLSAKEYVSEGPLFLSVHSLNYGEYVNFKDAFHITKKRYEESPEIMLRKDDILICKDGAGIGKTGIVQELNSPTTINSSLLLIRSNGEILPKYLYYYLTSPIFQTIIKNKIEGATTPHLYQREVKEMNVSYPSLEIQKKIILKLDSVIKDSKVINEKSTFLNENLKKLRFSIFSNEIKIDAA